MSQNCHLSISNLSRDALLFVTWIFGQIAILWKFSRRSLENFARSQKNKTVTFNDCILGIYGNNINDFQEPSLLHVLEGL